MTTKSQIAWRGVQKEGTMTSSGATTTTCQREHPARVTGLWSALREMIAPVGYEDELGFHYGDTADNQQAR